MSDKSEIVCYADPECNGRLDAPMDLLREHGYDVRIEDNVDAVHREIADRVPAAIFYTLVSDSSSWGKSFQSIASKAVEQSIPMMLIGPDDFAKGFTLYYPMDPLIDGKQVDFSMVVSVLDEIHGTAMAAASGGPPSESPSQNRLVDSFDEGEDSVKIETLVTYDEGPKITTLVSRHGEVVVREQQALHGDESDLTDKMEVQHIAALESYAPAPPPARRPVAGEVSGPIAVDRKIREATLGNVTRPGERRRTLRPLLIIGVLVICGVVIYLSTKQVTPLPRPVARLETGQNLSSRPPADPIAARGRGAGQEDDGVLEEDGDADPAGLEDGSGVLFPGRFRPNQTAFGFRNRKEEQQFVAVIAELAQKKKIRLVVRYRDRSVSGDRRRLGTARAKAVRGYLREQGIKKRQLIIDESMGRSADERPLRTAVNLILDQ